MLFLFKALVFTYDINTLLAWEIFLLHSIKKYIFALRQFACFFFSFLRNDNFHNRKETWLDLELLCYFFSRSETRSLFA